MKKASLNNCIITKEKANKIKIISNVLVELARKRYPKIPESLWHLSVIAFADDDFTVILEHNKLTGGRGVEFVWHKNKLIEQESKIIRRECKTHFK